MDINNKKILQASLLVAISGTLYGFLGYLGTQVLRGNFSIPEMLFWRFIIAGFWMLPFIIRKYSSKQTLHRIDKSILFYMFILGAIGYAGSSGFYFLASQYTGTGLAMVIFFSYPIAIALFVWLVQKKPLNWKIGFSLIAIIAGLFLLKDSSEHPIKAIGIVFGMLAAASYAFYVIGSKKFSTIHMDSNTLTMIVCFGCASIFFIFAVCEGSFSLHHSLKSWLNLLAFGIFATALPIQLMLEGLKHISSMRASIISVLEPLVTLIVGITLLSEPVSHMQLMGAVLILVSAILVQFNRAL